MIMVITREQQEKDHADSGTHILFRFDLIHPSEELRSLSGDTSCPVPEEGCSWTSSPSTAGIPSPSQATLACLLTGTWGMLMLQSKKVPRAIVLFLLICISFFSSLGSAGLRIMNLSFWQQALIDWELQLWSNLLTLRVFKVKATSLLCRYGRACPPRRCLCSPSVND